MAHISISIINGVILRNIIALREITAQHLGIISRAINSITSASSGIGALSKSISWHQRISVAASAHQRRQRYHGIAHRHHRRRKAWQHNIQRAAASAHRMALAASHEKWHQHQHRRGAHQRNKAAAAAARASISAASWQHTSSISLSARVARSASASGALAPSASARENAASTAASA